MQALLVGILTALLGIDMFDGLTHMHRPIVSGMLVGLIMGDMQTGLVTGAALELVYMGQAPIAGAQPPNVVVAGVAGTTFAIKLGLDSTEAIAFAVPFAVGMQALITVYFTILTPLMARGDAAAKAADTKAIDKLNYFGMGLLGLFYFIIGFLIVSLGSAYGDQIKEFLDNVAWITKSMGVAGGMMPAVGFAILMKIMYKKEYAIFLFLGFSATVFLDLGILPVAIFAVIIAIYDFQSRKSTEGLGPIEGGYEDGI